MAAGFMFMGSPPAVSSSEWSIRAVGALATVGGLCHAAPRPVRYAAAPGRRAQCANFGGAIGVAFGAVTVVALLVLSVAFLSFFGI